MIEERLVKRWFYKGKSYGSKLKAYKMYAKELLINEVLGPLQDYETDSGVQYQGREFLSAEDFAQKMVDFGFECDFRQGYSEDEGSACCNDKYAFCGRKYKKWIDSKARELMKGGK